MFCLKLNKYKFQTYFINGELYLNHTLRKDTEGRSDSLAPSFQKTGSLNSPSRV